MVTRTGTLNKFDLKLQVCFNFGGEVWKHPIVILMSPSHPPPLYGPSAWGVWPESRATASIN